LAAGAAIIAMMVTVWLQEGGMPVPDSPLTDLFRWIDLTAVFANALLGGVIARGERLDPIGSRRGRSCPGSAAV
jgi:hypothetical protein